MAKPLVVINPPFGITLLFVSQPNLIIKSFAHFSLHCNCHDPMFQCISVSKYYFQTPIHKNLRISKKIWNRSQRPFVIFDVK